MLFYTTVLNSCSEMNIIIVQHYLYSVLLSMVQSISKDTLSEVALMFSKNIHNKPVEMSWGQAYTLSNKWLLVNMHYFKRS